MFSVADDDFTGVFDEFCMLFNVSGTTGVSSGDMSSDEVELERMSDCEFGEWRLGLAGFRRFLLDLSDIPNAQGGTLF